MPLGDIQTDPDRILTDDPTCQPPQEAGDRPDSAEGESQQTGQEQNGRDLGRAERSGEETIGGNGRFEPEAGSSRKESQFGGEACMNQAVCGRAGRRPGLPPKPSEKPKGSFQRPKPHVPGRSASETRARRLKVQGGICFKRLRGIRA